MDKCGNCGWDGKTPLDSGDPKVMDSTEAVFGKQCEWVKYKQDTEWDAKDVCNTPSDYVQGCLVFYIDVGQLPPVKAEAFVDKMKQQLNDKDGLTRIRKHNEIFFVPVRSNVGTRVKYIAFN